jgi:hypothetical protein
MYVFEFEVEIEAIRKILGLEVGESATYDTRKVFFMKGNKMVFSQRFPVWNKDTPPTAGQVVFDLSAYPENYAVFEKEAVFDIEPIEDNHRGGEYYYLMRPIKN